MGKNVTKQVIITCDNCNEETTEEEAEEIRRATTFYLCGDCKDKYPKWFKNTAQITRITHLKGKEFPSPEQIENNVWLVHEGEDPHFSKHDTVKSAKNTYEQIEEETPREEYFFGIFDGKEKVDTKPQKGIKWT